MMHRLPYTMQQSCGGLHSALATNTFLPVESLQTASATPYQSSYCMPRVSVPMPSSLPEERVYPPQQPVSTVEMQEQAYRVPEARRVTGSMLDGTDGGMFYSKTPRDVLGKTAAVNAVELQQTVEALKAQIERLRAHCAALEAKAGGDAADRVPKQSDDWTGPLLNEMTRPSERDGDGLFVEMRQASHHDSEKAAVNAVELQQTVEALKAQIERLRAHCAALEAKAGGDAADRVPKQSDDWTGPLLNEMTRPSERDGDGLFVEMRQASHHDSEKKRFTGGSPLDSKHLNVGLRGSTDDEVDTLLEDSIRQAIGSSVEGSIMHGAQRTKNFDEDNDNLVKLYRNYRRKKVIGQCLDEMSAAFWDALTTMWSLVFRAMSVESLEIAR
uniref:Uncharacterized protein n=1 Tax=Ascaris lumbricoides TaxID=6252 RepID=A0A0M3INK3_ASCLU